MRSLSQNLTIASFFALTSFAGAADFYRYDSTEGPARIPSEHTLPGEKGALVDVIDASDASIAIECSREFVNDDEEIREFVYRPYLKSNDGLKEYFYSSTIEELEYEEGMAFVNSRSFEIRNFTKNGVRRNGIVQLTEKDFSGKNTTIYLNLKKNPFWNKCFFSIAKPLDINEKIALSKVKNFFDTPHYETLYHGNKYQAFYNLYGVIVRFFGSFEDKETSNEDDGGMYFFYDVYFSTLRDDTFILLKKTSPIPIDNILEDRKNIRALEGREDKDLGVSFFEVWEQVSENDSCVTYNAHYLLNGMELWPLNV